MKPFLASVIDLFNRMGAGCAASQQGEYLHGWLPAMAQRPHTVEAVIRSTKPNAWHSQPCPLMDNTSHAEAA